MDPVTIGRQIKQQYPYYAKFPDEMVGNAYLKKYGGLQQELKETGAKAEIQTKEELKREQLQREAKLKWEQEHPEPSEAEEKRERAKQDAERIIKLLEETYFGARNGESLAFGRVEGAKQKIKAMAGQNPELSAYLGLRDSVKPTFARAMGDVGNLSKPEQEQAVKNLPTGMNTPEESIRYFKLMRAKFGLSERNYGEISPNFSELYTKVSIPGAFEDLGYSEKDINPPGKVKKEPSGLERILPTAGLAAATGLSLLPPVGPLAFLKGLGMVGRGALAGGIVGATQPAEELGERVTGATTGALGGGLLGGILRPLQTTRVLGGIARAKAADVKISTQPAIQAAKDYVKDVPIAKGFMEKILPSLQKTKEISLSEAEKKLERWGALTYSRAGDPKSTAQAGLMNILYGAVRQQIAEKAPLVSAARTTSSAIQKGHRYLGKIASPIGIGAAAGGALGSGLVYKWLFGRD